MCFFKKLKLNALLKKVKKLHQLRDSGGQSDIKREVMVLMEIARFYDRNRYNKDFPHADTLALEYYRAAAVLEDHFAQYICSQRFFDKAKFWDAWATGMYSNPMHEKYAKTNYEEAFYYLQAAELGGYALAKRLHGLAYIHGWGVEKNTNEGFKYVIDSIEMEDAWSKATKIFEDLKLNSPEFFAALMEYKTAKK